TSFWPSWRNLASAVLTAAGSLGGVCTNPSRIAFSCALIASSAFFSSTFDWASWVVVFFSALCALVIFERSVFSLRTAGLRAIFVISFVALPEQAASQRQLPANAR